MHFQDQDCWLSDSRYLLFSPSDDRGVCVYVRVRVHVCVCGGGITASTLVLQPGTLLCVLRML